MHGEEARRFTLIRKHPEHTPHVNEDGAGCIETVSDGGEESDGRSEKVKGLRFPVTPCFYSWRSQCPRRGYPRERCISGSGAGEPRYMNGGRLFVAVPVPPKGVPQGALYIREWGGGTPLYARQVVRSGGPSGVRTRVFAVRGRRPGPLDDGTGWLGSQGSNLETVGQSHV